MENLICAPGSHREKLQGLLSASTGPWRIASAYVTDSSLLLGSGKNDIRLLTVLKEMDIITGATSLDEMEKLIAAGVQCRLLSEQPRFHGKIYIFNNKAVVTSANLTRRGLDANLEVGVIVDLAETIELRNWFDACWAAGGQVFTFALLD